MNTRNSSFVAIPPTATRTPTPRHHRHDPLMRAPPQIADLVVLQVPQAKTNVPLSLLVAFCPRRDTQPSPGQVVEETPRRAAPVTMDRATRARQCRGRIPVASTGPGVLQSASVAAGVLPETCHTRAAPCT
jgi:hypothetical protein